MIREAWMGTWSDADLKAIQDYQDATGLDWHSAVQGFAKRQAIVEAMKAPYGFQDGDLEAIHGGREDIYLVISKDHASGALAAL